MSATDVVPTPASGMRPRAAIYGGAYGLSIMLGLFGSPAVMPISLTTIVTLGGALAAYLLASKLDPVRGRRNILAVAGWGAGYGSVVGMATVLVIFLHEIPTGLAFGAMFGAPLGALAGLAAGAGLSVLARIGQASSKGTAFIRWLLFGMLSGGIIGFLLLPALGFLLNLYFPHFGVD